MQVSNLRGLTAVLALAAALPLAQAGVLGPVSLVHLQPLHLEGIRSTREYVSAVHIGTGAESASSVTGIPLHNGIDVDTAPAAKLSEIVRPAGVRLAPSPLGITGSPAPSPSTCAPAADFVRQPDGQLRYVPHCRPSLAHLVLPQPLKPER